MKRRDMPLLGQIVEEGFEHGSDGRFAEPAEQQADQHGAELRGRDAAIQVFHRSLNRASPRVPCLTISCNAGRTQRHQGELRRHEHRIEGDEDGHADQAARQ